MNFEGVEIQKSNVPTERAQRVDEKNRAIFLVIRFIPRVIVIKMPKIVHLLYFLLMIAKNVAYQKLANFIWKKDVYVNRLETA